MTDRHADVGPSGRQGSVTVPAGRSTPFLLVDEVVLADNIHAMADLARRHGWALRPHAKTHKSPDIARLQLEAGAAGLTVATLGEAEVFAASGVTDLFVAFPLWVDRARGARLRSLRATASVLVGVDSASGVDALATEVPGAGVLVEIDSGQRRSGTAPERAGELALHALAGGLDVRGVFTFPGHGYVPGRQADVAAQEADALGRAVASLAGRGLAAAVVSGGSTPTASHTPRASVLSELRPGSYVFNDSQQWELGCCGPDQVALTCVATVVSHGTGDRVVLDAGSKALGADRPAWTSGWGRLPDHPEVRVVSLSEHHAVLAWDGSPPPVGSRVRVAPNHVCNAVALAEELVRRDGSVWPVTARGALA